MRAIQHDLGWSRSDIAVGSAIMAFMSAILLPVLGYLTDRFGPLRVGGIGLAGYGLMLLALSAIPGQLAIYYAVLFGLAFAFAASTAVTVAPLITRRFVRRRGLAVGIMMSGPAILLIPVSPLLAMLIANISWRAGYAALGLGALLVGLPGLLLAARGFRLVAKGAAQSVPGLDLGDALRTPAYWKLVVGTMFASTALGGFLTQFAAMLADKHFTAAQVGTLGSIFVASVLVGRTGVGALLDRWTPPFVAMTSLLSSAAGALLMLVPNPGFPLAMCFLTLVGAAFGAEGDVQAFFSARLFGLRRFSTLFGTLAMLNAAGVGLGALLFARIYDVNGSYDFAIYAAAAFLTAGGAVFGTLPRTMASSPISVSHPSARD